MSNAKHESPRFAFYLLQTKVTGVKPGFIFPSGAATGIRGFDIA